MLILHIRCHLRLDLHQSSSLHFHLRTPLNVQCKAIPKFGPVVFYERTPSLFPSLDHLVQKESFDLNF